MVPRRRLTLLLTVVGAFMLFGSSASAMCVYNFTDRTIDKVDFYCGIFCKNEWSVAPNGGVQCRPNEKGVLETGQYTEEPSEEARVAINIEVEAHGWVEMRPVGGAVQVCAYRQDRSQSVCQSYNPDNPGG